MFSRPVTRLSSGQVLFDYKSGPFGETVGPFTEKVVKEWTFLLKSGLFLQMGGSSEPTEPP